LGLGCATKYRLTSLESDHFSGKIALPDGPADRLIVRVDNAEDSWLHIRWSDAKIVGITGFAVPAHTAPASPLGSIPPRSSVEYHLFPSHDYWPEGYYRNRRDGFSRLLVYDSDYDRVLNSDSRRGATMELYVPSCRGEAVTSCSNKDEGAWGMTYIRGQVEREVR
jgi:hypothetical protein